MKKIVLLISIIFVMLMGFIGCENYETVFMEDEQEYSSLTGVIKEQTKDNKYLGTHILTDEKGAEIPLRSLTINLSSRQYLNNKVQVLGFENEDDKVFEVIGISILELLQKENNKVKLLNYKNTDFGIQINYYNDWRLEESDSKIIFYAPSVNNQTTDKVEISRNNYNSDKEDPLIEYFSEHFPEIKNISSLINKIGIDKLNAIKLEKNNQINYYLYRDSYIYNISFVSSENFIASNKKVFNEMLSSFRFTAFTVNNPAPYITELPVIDMEFSSFESLPYHFSAKYPKNWYYAGAKGLKEAVLHHYGFSDESVTEENEIISLDVMSQELPFGEPLDIKGLNGVKIIDELKINIYISVGSRTYRITGPSNYESIMIIMAASITPVSIEKNQ